MTEDLPAMYELCLVHARASRGMRTVVSEQLGSYHLTMMEWLALGVISDGARDGLSMTRVAADLDVTLPQVTALVSDLIKLKYIKQRILESDHRGRQVVMTLKGKRVLAKLEKSIAFAMHDWHKEIPKEQLKAYLLTVSQLASKS